MTAWSSWPAPAKLNLFLKITGRRGDGYHLLQTVFQLLDRGDTVRLRVRHDGRVERLSELAGVAPAQDLVVRAALALRPYASAGAGADITVEKRIPLGGGLGGGSSDAATVLVALNRLWGCGLAIEALARAWLVIGRGRSGVRTGPLGLGRRSRGNPDSANVAGPLVCRRRSENSCADRAFVPGRGIDTRCPCHDNSALPCWG